MKTYQYLVLISSVLLFVACSEKDDSSSSSSSSGVSDSSMVSAMPSNLSVSSNTESGSSVSSRTAGRTSAKINDDSDPKKHADKVARLQAVLNTTDISQCHKAIPKKMKGDSSKYVSCYGPQLAYVNHPADNSSDGTLPTGDLGIWSAYNDNSTQEACSVGQMNLLMDKIGRKVDLAVGITAMMICAAKNDSLSRPTVDGDALDVTASVAKTQMSAKRGGMEITSATLKRSTLASGKIKYLSKLVGSFSYTDSSNNTDNQNFTIKFQHVPDTESSTLGTGGEGLIQMWQEGLNRTDGNCGGSTLDTAMSVAYKNTSDNVSIRAVKANFSDNMTSSEFFGSGGEVRGTSITDNSSAGWCADLNVVRANLDSSGFGKIGYAWQAGKGDGYTRTFNIKTDNTSGTLSGDAYFGFNPHPDNSSGTNKYRSTKIDRMICNWAGPNNSRTGVSKVQRQQLSFDSTANVWKSATDNITFAPTNDCNFDNSSYSTTTFGGYGASITNNLESISNYNTNFGSQPTKPEPTLE
ncbi:MAG: hypothetical protein H8E38_08055 [SAR324 cluster bacterium]|nr:hypothetical protein [SAR324 cluster bacterium]MBL7035195.1 hypothetical protein [SAR324 cluster bacterium]